MRHRLHINNDFILISRDVMNLHRCSLISLRKTDFQNLLFTSQRDFEELLLHSLKDSVSPVCCAL